jgi:hypothetical protein
MQQSSEEVDLRRLERVRLLALAREPRLAMQLGFVSSLRDQMLGTMPAGHARLGLSSLYYPPPMAASTMGNLLAHPTMLQLPPPLPLSVTRGLVQSTGPGFDYTKGELTGPPPTSSPKGMLAQQEVAPCFAAEEDLQARYENESELPAGFKPGPNSVIIGRKKNCYTSAGNLRLRDICLMRLPAYSKCTKKKDKSEIVTDVVKHVRDSCPAGGAFMKRNSSGRWSEVKDVVARERVASIFRDFLHDQYRSSSKSKVAKRREMRVTQFVKTPGAEEEDSQMEVAEDDVHSETSAL